MSLGKHELSLVDKLIKKRKKKSRGLVHRTHFSFSSFSSSTSTSSSSSSLMRLICWLPPTPKRIGREAAHPVVSFVCRGMPSSCYAMLSCRSIPEVACMHLHACMLYLLDAKKSHPSHSLFRLGWVGLGVGGWHVVGSTWHLDWVFFFFCLEFWIFFFLFFLLRRSLMVWYVWYACPQKKNQKYKKGLGVRMLKIFFEVQNADIGGVFVDVWVDISGFKGTSLTVF